MCVTWVVGVGDGGADGVGLQGEGGRRGHGCGDTDGHSAGEGSSTSGDQTGSELKRIQGAGVTPQSLV